MIDGFDEFRSLQVDSLPNSHEQGLLLRHLPRIYVADGQEGPIDFYRDYIAHGCLEIKGQDEQDCTVDQADLNAVKKDPSATFTHQPATPTSSPKAYGSIYRGTVELPGLEPSKRNWTFLRYHFAFRHSGIATGVQSWQALVLGLIGNLDDWHQLDHYTSAIVVLDENERPIAVMLQQHNYVHTYLVGVEPAFPADGPFSIDVAERSNEFYPHRPEPTDHPAVSFLNAESARWLGGVEARSITDTLDRTSPDREIDYELEFLPPDDAFYVFFGRLGEKRRAPGRDGPPGALYYTWPTLAPYEISMPIHYWVAPDPEFVEIMADFDANEPERFLPQLRKRLAKDMRDNGLVS